MLGRQARYQANFDTLAVGMAEMGFYPYLSPAEQGCIITTFLVPDDANWDFEQFYSKLSERGIVIYPGKLTKAECFRLGSIGRLFPSDMRTVVLAVKDVLTEIGVNLPVTQKKSE